MFPIDRVPQRVGDQKISKSQLMLLAGFQSIASPSEQEILNYMPHSFDVYTKFPIDRVPQRVGEINVPTRNKEVFSFQSIASPSEQEKKESIMFELLVALCFQSIASPSEQEKRILFQNRKRNLQFPIDRVPQRVGELLHLSYQLMLCSFQSIASPSEQEK